MNKCCIKRSYFIGCPIYLLLQTLSIPMLFLHQTNILHHLTNLVFNWTILWMIWWPWDDGKVARIIPSCHCIMNVSTVMCLQVIPYKDSMQVGSRNVIGLNIRANIVTEVTKVIVSCTNSTITSNLPSWIRCTPPSKRRKSRISGLYRKQYRELSSICRMSACRFCAQMATFCVVSGDMSRHVSVMSQTQENVVSARVSKRHDI